MFYFKNTLSLIIIDSLKRYDVPINQSSGGEPWDSYVPYRDIFL